MVHVTIPNKTSATKGLLLFHTENNLVKLNAVLIFAFIFVTVFIALVVTAVGCFKNPRS